MSTYSDALYCVKCQKDISETNSVVLSKGNGKSLDYICMQCLKKLMEQTMVYKPYTLSK